VVNPLDQMYDTAKMSDGTPVKNVISRADFWHLASHRAVVTASDGNCDLDFSAGRVDFDSSKITPRFVGRLPDAFAWSEMQRVSDRNGMDEVTAAALMGAHTVGQCHVQASGYEGAWDWTPKQFDANFWKAMLNGKWFVHNIQSVDSQTGAKRTKTQFSLGGSQWDTSVMLFSDMGMHDDLTTCNWSQGEPVANGNCPQNHNPSGIASAIQNWANNPSAFYDAFSAAWAEMSLWGCKTCYQVDEFTRDINCASVYHHSCTNGYPNAPVINSWSSGWSNPNNKPPSTGPSSGGITYAPKPTPGATTTTTRPPSTTTRAPYTTQASGSPTRLPATTPAPTTPAPTTTPAPITTEAPVTTFAVETTSSPSTTAPYSTHRYYPEN